jgi:hypothetical protein
VLPILDQQLAERSRQDLRAPAVRDQVHLVELVDRRERPEELLQVVDGELAGLPVLRVALEEARRSGGPRVEDGHASSSREVPELGHELGRVVEGVLEAVHVHGRAATRRYRQPPAERGGEDLERRILLGDDLGIADERAVEANNWQRRRRETPELGDRSDADGHGAGASRGRRVGEQDVPVEVAADLHGRRAERDGGRPPVPVAKAAVGALHRFAVRHVEDVNRARLQRWRQLVEELVPAVDVDVRRRHELPLAGGEGRSRDHDRHQ